jgi:hypothetical protein
VRPAATAQAIPKPGGFRILCLFYIPALLGAAAFLLCFPKLSAAPGNLLEAFATWWFVVTPISTAVAFIILVRATWKNRWPGRATALAWSMLVGTVLVDAFFVLVMLENSP